uniref:protein phosphatase methylesterase 1-like n=1 Tax=Styela clava TaxID=7725 RepID=UPI001939333E|nr:protein phosphatase methylesterase 1-like [Styela clava]
MSALQRKLQGASGLPPKVTPYSRPQAKKKDYSTTAWTTYYDSERKIQIDESNSVFHMYRKGTEGPIIVFLHGGGFSGLSWAVLSKSLCNLIHCQCIAFDQRGHGQTSTENDTDLSAERLSEDVGEFVNGLISESSSTASVILVGHSMGGAIAIHAAAKNKIPNLVGLIVIDVVEGSAIESLHAMQGVLKNRPQSFESAEKATEWCVRTGYVRNLESAKVSMIGQLKRLVEPIQVSNRHYSDSSSSTEIPQPQMSSITEEESDESSESSSCCDNVAVSSKTSPPHLPQNSKTHYYTWRIDLSKTSKYWQGWFKGMSSMFLSVDVPKMLMLAGVDRLDAQLTTAQMQGKFQMQVLSKTGHAVHEDAPDKVAEAIAGFLVRHKFAEPASDFKRPFPAC